MIIIISQGKHRLGAVCMWTHYKCTHTGDHCILNAGTQSLTENRQKYYIER